MPESLWPYPIDITDRRHHLIYGLYQRDHPEVILYVGSSILSYLSTRFEEHRTGQCRTTAKCAKRDGVDLSTLEVQVLMLWESEGENPEGKIIRRLQFFGQARWNFPHALSAEAMRKGRANGRRKGGITRTARDKAQGTGFFDPEVSRRAQIRGAAMCKARGIGIFAPGVPRKAGRVSITRNRARGTGVFDPEVRRRAQLAVIATNKAQGTGLFDPKIQRIGTLASIAKQKARGTGLFNPEVRQKGRHVCSHVNRNWWRAFCPCCQADAGVHEAMK